MAVPTPVPRTPIERVELRDAVTLAIRDMILSGQVAPGERLVETDVAERFGTSRGPVRDALAELERSGLVEIRNRRGTFVAAFTAEDVDELYSLRGSLEELAVRRAATRCAPEQIAAMRAALSAIGGALDASGTASGSEQTRAIGEADMALHRSIIEAADHRRLADAWERLADQTLLMMRYLTDVRPEIQGPDGEHGPIIDALEAGDADAAVVALREHLDRARRSVRERSGLG